MVQPILTEDCAWDSLSTDVVWDFQTKTWDGYGIWYIWGADQSVVDGWTPDLAAATTWTPDLAATAGWVKDTPISPNWTPDQPPANLWTPEAPLTPCS